MFINYESDSANVPKGTQKEFNKKLELNKTSFEEAQLQLFVNRS